MSSVRAVLELAVADRLKKLLRAEGGYLVAARPGAYELSHGDDDAAIKRDIGGLPAILLFTDGGPLDVRGMDQLRVRETIPVTLLLCSGNLRGAQAQRHGHDAGGADPGVYKMIDDVFQRLQGAVPALDGAGRLVVAATGLFKAWPSLTVWRIVYNVAVDLERALPAVEQLREIAGHVRFPAADEPSETDRVVVTTSLD